MKFRTEIEPFKPKGRLEYSTNIFTIGSCFARNIAVRLTADKFRVTQSPLGILFNPASIADALSAFESLREADSGRLVHRSNGWVTLDCHSDLAQPSPQAALEAYRYAVEVGHKALSDAHCVIITLGTAIVYEHIATGKVVANCHKQPQSEFIRRRMDVEEIVRLFTPLLRGILSKKYVIFTLSPIRHVADGLAENSMSKATLRVAIGRLCEQFYNVDYFPAYEIVNDDLRDYRFYADDLVHPSSQAVEYIYERFAEALFTEPTKVLLPKVRRVVAAAAHRPSNPDSDEYRAFCSNYLQQAAALTMVDFSRECALFEQYSNKS